MERVPEDRVVNPAGPRVGSSLAVASLLAVLAGVTPDPGHAADAAAIERIVVMPVDGRVEVRVRGRNLPKAKILKLKSANKVVLDFEGTRYRAARVALGPPGLGDVRVVRGAQFRINPVPVARVVIELERMVAFTYDRDGDAYVLALATEGVAGPDADDEIARVAAETAAPEATVEPKADAAASKPATPVNPAAATPASAPTGGQASVLHAMVTDLPDRVRLVVTADGVLRYKLASENEGRNLKLSLYDVDLKWRPARLAFKEGPIREVRARKLQKPSSRVQMDIRLRDPRPYYVRRDQNQVVVEVEKAPEGEQVSAELGRRRGDLRHKVTLNVQNEDLVTLIKAMAFEAGFDNVMLNPRVKGTVSMTLREVSFGKALNLILPPRDLVWKVEGGVLKVASAAEFDRELEMSALSGGSASSDGAMSEGGIVTRVFRLKYISAFDIREGGVESGVDVAPLLGGAGSKMTAPPVVFTEILKAVKDSLQTEKGTVTVDARSNSLVVTDAASNMPRISKLIDELDVPIPQVHIQARLVQINTSSVETLGVNWQAERALPSNPGIRAAGTVPQGGPFSMTTGWLGPGFNLNATLDLLQSKGEGKTLLSPSITTMHDRAATVSTLRTVYYRQTNIQQVAGGNIITTVTFVPLQVPIELMVRPHVNPDDRLIMDTVITMVSIVPGGQADAPPNTSQQVAATRLMIRSGETGVIGGMLTDDIVKSVRRVPLLGHLPWFLGGNLFRSESVDTVKLELLLFLTPTIDEQV